MDDYIDRQLAEKTISDNWIKYVPMELDINLAFVLAKLDELPPADVVEVVRCKDCRYWEETLNGKGYCKDISGFGRWWKGNDYCSYGERIDG